MSGRASNLAGATLRAVAAGLAVLILFLGFTRVEAQDEAAEPPSATLAGRVVSAMTGKGLPNASVRVDAEGRAVVTDSKGRFRIAGLRPGPTSIAVARLGVAKQSIEVELKPRTVTKVVLLASETAIQLEDINVTVESNSESGKLAGFWRRSREETGVFLTPEDIESTAFERPTDLLRGIPGLRVRTASHGNATVQMGRRTQNCRPSYYFDGVPAQTGRMDDLNPEDLHAVEIYRGPSEVPLEFGGLSNHCGVILVWTKEGSG